MEINNNKDNIDTSNIFDDFTDDESLKEEIKQIVDSQQKDLYFYLQKIKTLLQVFIVFGMIFIILSYFYLYVQNNTSFKNSNLIDPICFVILGDIVNDNTYCSSVESLFNQYTNEIVSLKESHNNKINLIFDSVYKRENFLYSKEVIFLKNKTDSRLNPLNIMEEFDDLLFKFEPIEKEKLDCFNMEIYSDNKIKVTCEAYSSGYDKAIKGFDGTTNTLVGGSSISYANSFINFIKTQSTKFIITSEDKTFKSTPLLLENNGFTDKTKFDLELIFTSKNIIF